MKLNQASGTALYAKPLIRALEPGQSAAIELPDSKYWKMEAANAVRGTAAHILERGTFTTSVKDVPGSIVVRRV